MTVKEKSGSFMDKVAAFIVDKRYLFLIVYIFILVFCLISMSWTQVENDVTVYLPAESETRQGIVAMNENFVAAATARVMVSNITPETAQGLADRIAKIPGIAMVTFGNTPEHYKDATALFDLMFAEDAMSQSAQDAVSSVRTALEPYDYAIDTTVGFDANAMLEEEMLVILIVAVVIILIVLTLTSRSYAEVPVLLITFGVAALMNMGTHFLFGTISFISNSIAVVLQLALAIDYAIILCHRFNDERESKSARDACVMALRKAIPEISASSLTTVSGLAALAFMDFAIGRDMAAVLIKSILLSLLSVFTLMPGLLVLFDPLMKKTKHKKLLPDITPVGKFAVKTRRVVPFLFVGVIIASIFLSSACPYCYSFNDLKTAKMSEQQVAYFRIKDTFGSSNMMALVVPAGNYEAEAAILEELESRPEVKSAMGLANTVALGDYTLTDALTPRQLSELLNLDYEVTQLLYSYYATEQNQYGHLLNGLQEYAVPLFDMFMFLKEELQTRNISLGDAEMDAMLGALETAQKQLQSDKYSRMVLHLTLPEESEETFAFLDTIRAIVGKYYDGDYYVVGNSTSSRDLSSSFVSDNILISILSVFFVILVLLFTFRSAGLPVLLIAVIQGSIWINFSIPTLTGQPLYFLGYLIVNAIQMGANIDYAIVISSHYQEHKATMPHKQAIIIALNEAFPTVFTSGIMLASAGLLIGNMSAQPVVSIMGNCIGRGTIISMILVLFVLPSILVLGDSIIERTKFRIKAPELPTRTATGTMRVQGHVRGFVSGMVDAQINGVLHGQLNAAISTDGVVETQEEGVEEHA